MRFVPSLLPGLVGTAFMVVPIVAILMVAVVVSVVWAVSVPIFIFGLHAHGRYKGRTHQKRTQIPMQSQCISPLSGPPLSWHPLVPVLIGGLLRANGASV